MFASYVLAVLAAGSNAASNILQRKANRDEPAELSMRPGLIVDLLHRPVWLAGLGTVTLSFVLMAAALSMGQLARVQPIVVMELPLTLIGAAWFLHARLGAREWVASVVMTLGLAGLIASLSPSKGTQGNAPWLDWLAATVVSIAVVGAFVVAGLRARSGGRKAALLGMATGMVFGLTAAFMKGMTAAFDKGSVLGAVSAWQTYAMIAGGFAGMFLLQNALQAGRLIVAQPGITLADPVVAILWGVLVFHESTRTGLAVVVAVASAAAIGVGAVVLARSPALEDRAAEDERARARQGDGEGPVGAGAPVPARRAG